MAEIPFRAMEDHCEALPFWKDLGVQGLPCLHFDAHLDLSDEGYTARSMKEIIACQSGAELQAYRTRPGVPWGGFHGGNYLYPALLGGMVGSLWWIIPPWLPKGQDLLAWGRTELQSWYDMSLSDYRALHVVEGRLEGSILGYPLTICTAEQLPRFAGPVLLDIDADYFLDADDGLFCLPDEVLGLVAERAPQVRATTMAYSVAGGYLPPEQRYVGDVAATLCQGRDTRGLLEIARTLRKGDTLRKSGQFAAARRCYEKATTDQHLAGAAHYKLARLEAGRGADHRASHHEQEAARLCPAYQVRALDLAMLALRQARMADCRHWLNEACHDDPSLTALSRYLEGLSYVRAGEPQQALRLWTELAESAPFAPSEQVYLLLVLGRTLLEQGQALKGRSYLERAAALGPEHARSHHWLGVAAHASGAFEQAARSLRKAIVLEGDSLVSLESHRHLLAVYQASGHGAFAQAEQRRLQHKQALLSSSP